MPRKRSMTANAVAIRRNRRRRRQRIVEQLGGKCRKCGGERNLEFHHKQPRTWSAREFWYNARLRKYAEEAAAGLLELLCGTCNKVEGAPAEFDNGEF